MNAKPQTLYITLMRSTIGHLPRQRRTIRALGLRRIRQTVEHQKTPSILGMIKAVNHLVQVTEQN